MPMILEIACRNGNESVPPLNPSRPRLHESDDGAQVDLLAGDLTIYLRDQGVGGNAMKYAGHDDQSGLFCAGAGTRSTKTAW